MVMWRRGGPIRGAPLRMKRALTSASHCCTNDEERALPGTSDLLRCGAGCSWNLELVARTPTHTVNFAALKPVALIRAKGTKPIFDVDNMLRVEEYNPCLWRSIIETDLPKIAAQLRGAWNNREDGQTYMKILRNKH
jgi:hypothetical protein